VLPRQEHIRQPAPHEKWGIHFPPLLVCVHMRTTSKD
jgi:hypothetical protein